MNEWRHVEALPDGACFADQWPEWGTSRACLCEAPYPDPDSPCGACPDEQHVGPDIDGHPHAPTLCRCGHRVVGA